MNDIVEVLNAAWETLSNIYIFNLSVTGIIQLVIIISALILIFKIATKTKGD